jgi:hypothetical protein
MMEQDTQPHTEEKNAYSDRGPMLKRILNGSIVVALLVVGYFAYAIISRKPSQGSEGQEHVAPLKIIQLDVLNGCGGKGAASRFTSYLRAAGFDVVEMKNYKVSSVPRTLVVDRVGNLAAARRVASSLGVSENNVVQQLNPDYFVDVSVIIGGDYSTLRPSH